MHVHVHVYTYIHTDLLSLSLSLSPRASSQQPADLPADMRGARLKRAALSVSERCPLRVRDSRHWSIISTVYVHFTVQPRISAAQLYSYALYMLLVLVTQFPALTVSTASCVKRRRALWVSGTVSSASQRGCSWCLPRPLDCYQWWVWLPVHGCGLKFSPLVSGGCGLL